MADDVFNSVSKFEEHLLGMRFLIDDELKYMTKEWLRNS